MKLDHFFIKQLEKNLNLVIVFLINLVLIILLIIFFGNQDKLFNQQKNILSSEIEKLSKKNDLILFSESLKNKDLDLDKLNKILFLLIPNSEDYFSIALALEKISKKTDFLITNFKLNPELSSQGRLSVAITGSGDRNSFLNFVKDYNFIGNRLITIDKLDFSESNLNLDKRIFLNFYIDEKSNKENLYKLNKKDFEIINKIISKTELDEAFNFDNENSTSLDYETKTNPF